MAKKATNRSPKAIAPSPMWTLDDGISQTLLAKFIGCRERFRLYAVEGAREPHSKNNMDFGSYFHELLETHAKYPDLDAEAIIAKVKRKKRVYSTLSDLDVKVADVVFDWYLWNFEECNYRYIHQEDVFKVPYTPLGQRKLFLRGRFDEIIERPDGTIWIQENKTKERIDRDHIIASIPHNLQTMMYAVAAQIKYKKRVSGIVYNVIRKPKFKPSKTAMSEEELAAYKLANPKSKAKQRDETEEEFLDRIASLIEENPSHFYFRAEYPLSQERLDHWRRHTFDPLLTSVIQWWESVKHDPFSPWVERTKDGKRITVLDPITRKKVFKPNPHHWQRPHGVFDALTFGKGEYYDLLVLHNKHSIVTGEVPFQELVD
jgi:hypothetical protein